MKMPTPTSTDTTAQPGFHLSMKARPPSALPAILGCPAGTGDASASSGSAGGDGASVVVAGGGRAADVGVGADAGGATRAGAAAATLLATIGGALGAVAAAASSRPWQPTPHDAGRTVAMMRWTA